MFQHVPVRLLNNGRKQLGIIAVMAPPFPAVYIPETSRKTSRTIADWHTSPSRNRDQRWGRP